MSATIMYTFTVVTDKALTEILPLEEVVQYGIENGSCAYYGLRTAIPEADIILAPYACVLHKQTRESLNLKIGIDISTVILKS